jgi:hypothetical protein
VFQAKSVAKFLAVNFVFDAEGDRVYMNNILEGGLAKKIKISRFGLKNVVIFQNLNWPLNLT